MSEKNVWDILNRNLFFIKNAVEKREVKTSDKLDVYDPESRQILLECREPDIGVLTKTARFFGGKHDKGTKFNLVANIPTSKEQVLRIVRGNTTFKFGGAAINIYDQWNSLLGKLKRKHLTFEMEFVFLPEKLGDTFVLQIKNHEILCNGKTVAAFEKHNTDFFKENKFDYAFSINQEVPANSQMRQALLALAFTQHRTLNMV